jgi:hypothetical protein
MPSPRSAANPASHPPLPREHLPGLPPVAASRLVTGLSRASCRDATGLAVLMSTGRRAGLPGLSRPAAPAPRLARLVRITGPGRQIDIFSHRQLQRWAAGYREHRGLGQAGHQPHRGNGRPPGRWARVTHRAAWSDALACSRGRGQRARVGFRLCSCGEAAKAAWALDAPGLPEAAGAAASW